MEKQQLPQTELSMKNALTSINQASFPPSTGGREDSCADVVLPASSRSATLFCAALAEIRPNSCSVSADIMDFSGN